MDSEESKEVQIAVEAPKEAKIKKKRPALKLKIEEPRSQPEPEQELVAVEIGPDDAEIIMPRHRKGLSNIGMLAADLGIYKDLKNDSITSDSSCYEKNSQAQSANLGNQRKGSDMSLSSSIGSKASSNYWNGTINSMNLGKSGTDIENLLK